MWPFLRGKRAPKEKVAETRGEGKHGEEDSRLQELGVTDRLREFVKTFTVDTFRSFPLHDDQAAHPAGVCAQSNVRNDLTEWQERHATLVLSEVKEIAQLRYVLCPRHLKERQFWRIYFQLVKSYVAPYEMHAIQKARMKKLEMEVEESLIKGAIEVEMAETSHGTGSSMTLISKGNSLLRDDTDRVERASKTFEDHDSCIMLNLMVTGKDVLHREYF
ncbi:hypothetical protein BHM03_00028616 [Ensete ventricosum]|uniref:BSD domain-containing protein n=1 Tax=Ensete ventricosum TaxID=4639 RepID=A0A427ANI5_ENSVE|nr:hypothetical protein B296_00024674 [Ensete ventricosum]RZR99129.1 hypothetical protein BHM03_00028616 [Ensete ventricosum]